MCLGQIGRLVRTDERGGGAVEVGDVEQPVSLVTLEEPAAPGDWLLVHSGFALAKLTQEQALDALTVRATPPR